MTRINLIRELVAQPESRATERLPLRWFVVLVAAVVLHAVEVLWVGSAIEARDSLRRSVDDLERAVATARAGTPRVAAVDRTGRPSLAAARLRGIAASMPPDLWLVGYREHQDEAVMRGLSLNDEATRTFVAKLAAASTLGHIEIIETTHAAGTASPGETAPALYEFQLKAPLQHASAASATAVEADR